MKKCVIMLHEIPDYAYHDISRQHNISPSRQLDDSISLDYVLKMSLYFKSRKISQIQIELLLN